MKQTQTLLRIFQRSESGAILVLAALAMPILVLAIAGAVEFSRASYTKSQFNNAVEQAVLAAAATHAADPTTFGKEYLLANMNEMRNDFTLKSFQITTDGAKWTAQASGTLNSVFNQFLPGDKFNLNSKTVVAWDNTTTTELVAMVDVSGTMCARFKREGSVVSITPDKYCTKLDMMQDALSNIINTGTGYSQGGGLTVEPAYKVGILPFTFKAKVANPSALPSLLTKGESDAGYGTTYFTNLSDAEASGDPIPAVTPLLPITSDADKATLLKKISELNKSDSGSLARQAWKRSSLGAELSGMMLDPRYHNAFGGATPAAFGDAKTKKIVIMMTDSANLGCCYTNYPADNYTNHYTYSYNLDHQHLVGDGKNPGVCKQMKDAGIEIYTVLLDVDSRDMDTRGEEIVNSFQSCASDTNHAYKIPWGDQAALDAAYKQISQELIKLKVVE